MKRLLPSLLACFLLLAVLQPAAPAQASQALPSGGAVPGELLVGLADGVDPLSLALPAGAELGDSGAELETLHVAVVKTPIGQEEVMRRLLLADPAVLFAEQNQRVRALYLPNDPLWGANIYTPDGQYGLERIHAPAAWDLTTGSPGVILAMVDSGIDATHPEFAGRLLPGHDFVENDSIPQDLCGHGTHITGIAAASGDNLQGVAGMNWNTAILPVRVLDYSCTGDLADIARGIVWAVDQGADIVNLSLGLWTPSRLLEYATYFAYQRGTTVIAAAGNDGTPNSINYPAAYPWVLAVGSTGPGAGDPRSAFSSTGVQLDVMAPGEDILSTTPQGGAFMMQGAPYLLGYQYGVLDGTSMASALVSGAASLLPAFNPQFNTPERIMAALAGTARDLEVAGFDNNTGWGLVQVESALLFDPSIIPPRTIPAPLVAYDALSSVRCQNITYQWENVPLDLAHQLAVFNNDGYQVVTLPFTFPFGGVNYDQAAVSANGYIAFDGIGGEPVNWIIPQSDSGPPYARPDWYLAPFWDDLNPSAAPPPAPGVPGGGIYAAVLGSAPNRRYVVEWYRIPIQRNNTSTEVTFQALLYEGSGRIAFQYASLVGAESDGSSATVGLEFNDGHDGLQYAYNQVGAVQPGLAILFTPRPVGTGATTPACQEVTQVNAADGGLYWFGPFCLQIPAGLLAQDSTLRFSVFDAFAPRIPANSAALGHYAEITLDPYPTGAPFNPPPVICYAYTPNDLLRAGGRAGNLYLAAYDGETNLWERLPTVADESVARLTASTTHFSIFGVFADGEPDELPVTGARQTVGAGAWGLLLATLLAIALVVRKPWCV